MSKPISLVKQLTQGSGCGGLWGPRVASLMLGERKRMRDATLADWRLCQTNPAPSARQLAFAKSLLKLARAI